MLHEPIKKCKTPGCEVTGYENFYRHPQMGDGHLSFCKSCVKRKTKEHRASDPRVAERDRIRYYSNPTRRVRNKKKTPEAKYAQSKVAYAIKAGRISKPDICEECGRSVFLEAAHYDYKEPLLVRWLCRPCHRRWDASEPKGGLLKSV
jgi:ribosomal protein S27AE